MDFWKTVALQLLIFLMFFAYIETTDPKSVNLALETVLQFNKKDNAADVKFIDDVQQVLNKVKTAIKPKISRRKNENEVIKFSDFIKSAIEILKTYTDNDLEDVFTVFDSEIRKYHYKGCKFYELIEDHNIRKYVADHLDYLKEKPARTLRDELNKAAEAINNAKFSLSHSELVDYVNSLYRHNSSEKLIGFLINLQAYSNKTKRSNLNLVKLVKQGIRSVLFDHYTDLNANARRDLKLKLETTWRDINNPHDVNQGVWTMKYTNVFFKKSKHKNTNADVKKQDLTTREAKKIKTEKDASLEESEDYTTPYKHRQRHKKHGIVRVTKRKTRKEHKKISTFPTLYPEEVALATKKRRFKQVTREPKLYTLWEERIGHKKHKKEKTKHIRMKSDPAQIINTDMVINVKRSGMALEDITYDMHKKSHQRPNSKHKMTTEQRQSTKAKDTKHKQKTDRFRKYIPRSNEEPLSDEGMSIEVNQVERRSLSGSKNNDTLAEREIKVNVLRRINNLEKQMEEIKSKIDIQTTTDKGKKLLSNETKHENLEYRKGTAKNTPSKSLITNSTKTLTKVVHNDTSLSTTDMTTNKFKVHQNNSRTKNSVVFVTPSTITTTEKQENTTIFRESLRRDFMNIGVPELIDNHTLDSNIPDLEFDEEISNIAKKYNISVKNKKEKPMKSKLGQLLMETDIPPNIGNDELVERRLEEGMKKLLGENKQDKQDESVKSKMDELLLDTDIPTSIGKNKQVKRRVEEDMQRLLGKNFKMTETSMTAHLDFGDPFQDINNELELIRPMDTVTQIPK